MPLKKQIPKTIINSRHLKVLAANRDVLANSVVFISISSSDGDNISRSTLHNFAKSMEKVEPKGHYFVSPNEFQITIFDREEFKNRDVVVKFDTKGKGMTTEQATEMVESFERAFPNAKSISFIPSMTEVMTK